MLFLPTHSLLPILLLLAVVLSSPVKDGIKTNDDTQRNTTAMKSSHSSEPDNDMFVVDLPDYNQLMDIDTVDLNDAFHYDHEDLSNNFMTGIPYYYQDMLWYQGSNPQRWELRQTDQYPATSYFVPINELGGVSEPQWVYGPSMSSSGRDSTTKQDILVEEAPMLTVEAEEFYQSQTSEQGRADNEPDEDHEPVEEPPRNILVEQDMSERLSRSSTSSEYIPSLSDELYAEINAPVKRGRKPPTTKPNSTPRKRYRRPPNLEPTPEVLQHIMVASTLVEQQRHKLQNPNTLPPEKVDIIKRLKHAMGEISNEELAILTSSMCYKTLIVNPETMKAAARKKLEAAQRKAERQVEAKSEAAKQRAQRREGRGKKEKREEKQMFICNLTIHDLLLLSRQLNWPKDKVHQFFTTYFGLLKRKFTFAAKNRLTIHPLCAGENITMSGTHRSGQVYNPKRLEYLFRLPIKTYRAYAEDGETKSELEA